MHPLYVFQIICIILYFLEEYDYYPIVLIGYATFLIVNTLIERRKTEKKLEKLALLET